MNEFSIGFAGTAIHVSAPFDVYVAWGPLLEPFFTFGVRLPARARLQIEVRGTASSQLSGEHIPLHSDGSGILFRTPTGWIVSSPAVGALYELDIASDPPIVGLTYHQWSLPQQVDALQLVRGALILAAATRPQTTIAHFAAVSREGQAYLLIGDKGAGKTSFMLATLRAGRDWSLISNDKALLVANPNRELEVLGLPLAIPVSKDSLQELPSPVATGHHREANGKVLLWPSYVAEHLGAELAASGSANAVLNVSLALGQRPCASALPHPSPGQLTTVTAFSDKTTPYWLGQLLSWPRHGSQLCHRLLSRPWFSVQGDPWGDEWPDLLDRLFEHSRNEARD